MKRNSIATVFLLPFMFGWAHIQSPSRGPASGNGPAARGCGGIEEPAGTGGDSPVQHIIVIVQENHSFDTDFGALNQKIYTGAVNSSTGVDGIGPTHTNLSHCGTPVPQHRLAHLIPTPYKPGKGPHDIVHSWEGIHETWHGGLNDRFVSSNAAAFGDSGEYVMGYYAQEDLPYYYQLADRFAIADRYFCSAMGPTWVNRAFLYAGTSYGITVNPNWGKIYSPKYGADHLIEHPSPVDSGGDPATVPSNPKTIFDAMDARPDVTWKYYSGDYDSGLYGGYIGTIYPKLYNKDYRKFANIAQFDEDVAKNKLPLVSFLDASLGGDDNPENGQSEHPAQNVQYGQAWVAQRIAHVMANPDVWKGAVILLTYDENGGFYDHVPPPAAPQPDSILPQGNYKFDHYGMRVPLLAISPFAKPHYVSHTVYDHTSILRFIENRLVMGPLAGRDALADPLSDLFDFGQTPNTPSLMAVPPVAADPSSNPDVSVCGGGN